MVNDSSFFPIDWEPKAKELGAVRRRFRNFKNVGDFLRTLLLHVGRGYSLKETSAIVSETAIGSISGYGISKGLIRSERWLQYLCKSLLYSSDERLLIPERIDSGFNMRLIDGSVVKEPGKTGSQWRLHYSISLPTLECDYFKLTSTKGDGNGERLDHYIISPNDCLICDRGYSRGDDIDYVTKNGGYVIVRVNSVALSLFEMNGNKFNLISALSEVRDSGESKEFEVKVKSSSAHEINGRLCVIRKSDESIKLALKKLARKKTLKQQKTQRQQTIECAKYVIVFTTLPKNSYNTQEVLNWYRVRWQIELVFKKLKSIAGLGHLPKHNDGAAKSWLYAKLFIALLTNKIARYAKTISPWGY